MGEGKGLSTQHDTFKLGPLAEVEVKLRQGMMYDAICVIHLIQKACDALNSDKHKNTRGQVQKTRTSTRTVIPEKIIAAEIANYNAC